MIYNYSGGDSIRYGCGGGKDVVSGFFSALEKTGLGDLLDFVPLSIDVGLEPAGLAHGVVPVHA